MVKSKQKITQFGTKQETRGDYMKNPLKAMLEQTESKPEHDGLYTMFLMMIALRQQLVLRKKFDLYG